MTKFGDPPEAVTRYVNQHRSWESSDFHIELVRREGNVSVFNIIYKNDLGENKVTGGKSFQLYYDERKQTVVKELAFQ